MGPHRAFPRKLFHFAAFRSFSYLIGETPSDSFWTGPDSRETGIIREVGRMRREADGNRPGYQQGWTEALWAWGSLGGDASGGWPWPIIAHMFRGGAAGGHPHRHSGPRAGTQGPGTWIPTSAGMTIWRGTACYFRGNDGVVGLSSIFLGTVIESGLGRWLGTKMVAGGCAPHP